MIQALSAIAYLLSIVVFVSAPLCADVSGTEERLQILKTAFTKVASAKNLAFDVDIRLIGIDAPSADAVHHAYFRKRNKDIIQGFDGLTILVTGHEMISVDRQKKIIRYRPVNVSMAPTTQLPVAAWNNFNNELNKFEYRGKLDDLHRFSLANLPSVITHVDIFIFEDTGNLSRVEYEYNTKYTGSVKKAVIEYIWHDLSILDGTDFSPAQYIRFIAGRPVPSDAYSDFRFFSRDGNEK